MPYAFADFINRDGAEIAALYRERFPADGQEPGPQTAVAAWVLCAPSDEEAELLAMSSRMTLRMLRRGQLIPIPPPEKAREWLAREDGPRSEAPPGRRAIVGSPQTVLPELESLAEEYGADEVIVVTITHDHQARRRSYELLAQAVGLAGPRPEPADPVVRLS